MRTKIQHKIWAGILLAGYFAMLCSQAFVMPNANGESNVLNTRLVQHIFKAKAKTTATSALTKSIRKNTKSLQLRINKRFEKGKTIFILPQPTVFIVFNTALSKPLHYYSNHFVSSFLYVCEGRAPPAIA